MTTRSLALIGLVTAGASVSNTNSAAQPSNLEPQPAIASTAPAQGPRLRFAPVSDAYAVSGAASALVGGSQITRRKPGFSFTTSTVARPRFATSDGSKAIAQLRDHGGRFFRGVRKAPDDPLAASVFRTAQPLAGLPFLSLSLGDSGWGALALHAARHYGARVVGITLSQNQLDYAREHHLKVDVICPFVAGYLETHPEYSDLVLR